MKKAVFYTALLTLIQCQIACDRQTSRPEDDPVVKRAQEEKRAADLRRQNYRAAMKAVQDQLLRAEIAAASSEDPDKFQPRLDELQFAFEQVRVTVADSGNEGVTDDVALAVKAYREMLDQWRAAFVKLPAEPQSSDLRRLRERMAAFRVREEAISKLPKTMNAVLTWSKLTRGKIATALED